jgi:3-oxoacyl-[acyl-carrier protein] reductase
VTYRSEPPPGSEAQGVLAVGCDVRSTESVDAAFGEVEAALGPVQVLVSNAGATRDGLLLRMGDDAFAEVVDTNLAGSYRVAKRAASGMLRARSGRMVFLSSVVALTGLGRPGELRRLQGRHRRPGPVRGTELASRGITANVVAPGRWPPR